MLYVVLRPQRTEKKIKLSFIEELADAGKYYFRLPRRFMFSKRHSVPFVLPDDHGKTIKK